MNLINDLILKAMENSETKQQLEELDFSISQIEKDIETLNKTLSFNIEQLEKLQHRKQSIINYLNE